jgi:hypothetical protein
LGREERLLGCAERKKGEKKGRLTRPCGRERRAGWARPQGKNERGKRKRRVGRAQLGNKRKKYINAFEFEIKI